jgi:hypothetical protein
MHSEVDKKTRDRYSKGVAYWRTYLLQFVESKRGVG